MLIKGFFDLLGTDAISSDLDHVPGPPDDEDETLFVRDPDIPGEVQPIPQDPPRFLGLAPVTLHDVRPTGHDLSLFPWPDRMTLLVRDKELDVGDGLADRAPFSGKVLG